MEGNVTISERAVYAIGRLFTVLDLPPDVLQTIKAALDHEFASARTYDPATHIVVSREAGERVAKIIEYDVCGRENCKCGELAAELRAAMEGEK